MMDSLAPPGTEDEPLVSFSASTKQEKERERLLSLKTILPNGTYGPVYEFNYINGTEHWYCNACACPVMGWVFHHETGKRHKMALGSQTNERHHSSHDSEETPVIQIAPGEPAPPGFEGQVEKIAAIQERLDVFNVGPLVALEYLLELKDYDATKEPTYLCVLCDKKGDPRTVLTHLASYKHILQYLQKHFPTCYRALAPYMTKQYKRNWQSCLHEVAEAIEKKFGRLKPMPVEADKYEKETVYYLELIAKGRHFSELSGYTFEELVNKDELTKVHDDENDKYGYNKSLLPQTQQRKKSPSPPVVANPIKKVKVSHTGASSSAVGNRRRSLSSVSSVSSSDLSDFEEPKERKPPRRSRSRSRSPYRNRSRSPYNRRYSRRSPPPPRRDDRDRGYYRRDQRDQRDQRDLMPWERPNYRRTKPDNSSDRTSKEKQDKFDEYKKLCRAIDNDMERILKQHKKNPEKHPQYNDEWKKFWNRRYKELQTEGKDVSSHDFKPEWIEFWNKRMIELHQDEVKAKKESLRKRLGLPDEPTPISFKIQSKKKYEVTTKKPIPPSALPDHDPEVIVIDDKDTESKSSRRSHSPWEDEPAAPRSNSRNSRERERTKSRERERSPKSRSPRGYRDRSYERSWDRERDRADRDRDRDHRDYRPRERIRIVSELPWERNKYKNEIPSYYKPPSVMRDVTREPVRSPPRMAPTPVVEEPEDDSEINIVAVLRLLTALEEKLGSLGPKVIDLLAQALGMEKTEANSSELLLDNEINCVLFETVKEKLKGTLLAGLVEPLQERAIKRAIKKTASLIHIAEERKREKTKNVGVDPVKVPGVGTVDKAAIAKQIANALIAQGKTDVTQAELEQLINAVVGMAEASRKSNKPMTTASFLEQINKAGTSVDVAKEKSPVKEKEIVPTIHKTVPVVVKEVVTKTPEKVSNNMEGLSDSDLQTLLQNFKDLSTEEQHGLINYLKKLEAHEPDRVERLRKFVNLGGGNVGNNQTQQKEKLVVEKKCGRESPFSNRTGSVNPTIEEKQETADNKSMINKFPIVDSDEEDYTFEDLAKAASKNVKQQELEKEREIVVESMKLDAATKKDDLNLDETKAIISNIMGNINKTDASMGLNADFAKTLNSLPVNIANLANIVGSVQNMAQKQPAPYQNVVRGSYQNQNSGFQQNRPNVSYPIIDKSKVAYPNYSIYGQEQDRFVRPQFGQQNFRGGNQYGNLPNRGNTNNNSSNNYNNRW